MQRSIPLFVFQDFFDLWRYPITMSIPEDTEVPQKAPLLGGIETPPDSLTVATDVVEYRLPGQLVVPRFGHECTNLPREFQKVAGRFMLSEPGERYRHRTF